MYCVVIQYNYYDEISVNMYCVVDEISVNMYCVVDEISVNMYCVVIQYNVLCGYTIQCTVAAASAERNDYLVILLFGQHDTI